MAVQVTVMLLQVKHHVLIGFNSHQIVRFGKQVFC